MAAFCLLVPGAVIAVGGIAHLNPGATVIGLGMAGVALSWIRRQPGWR